MAYFYRYVISNIPLNYEESVSTFCFDYSALGVYEKLDFDSKVYPDPKVIKKTHITLEVFFEKRNQEFEESLKEVYPEVQLEVYKEENKDWLEEWKKGFHSFKLVEDYWVVPSWEKGQEKNINPIYIDPGMAFGTGTHETTQICSELIYETFKKNKIESVLDVGTGTGILAILSEKLGAKNSIGIDNDPEAVRVANENSKTNNSSFLASEKEIHHLENQFDIVVANIIDGVLLQMKNQLLSKKKDGGFLILSGIIIENDKDFISDFLNNSNLFVLKRMQKGEWVGYLLK